MAWSTIDQRQIQQFENVVVCQEACIDVTIAMQVSIAIRIIQPNFQSDSKLP